MKCTNAVMCCVNIDISYQIYTNWEFQGLKMGQYATYCFKSFWTVQSQFLYTVQSTVWELSTGVE